MQYRLKTVRRSGGKEEIISSIVSIGMAFTASSGGSGKSDSDSSCRGIRTSRFFRIRSRARLTVRRLNQAYREPSPLKWKPAILSKALRNAS